MRHLGKSGKVLVQIKCLGIGRPVPFQSQGSIGANDTIQKDGGQKRGRSVRPTSLSAPPGEAPNHEYRRDWEAHRLYRVDDSDHRVAAPDAKQDGEAQIHSPTVTRQDRVGVVEPQSRECEAES